jgi:hypothetical protein
LNLTCGGISKASAGVKAVTEAKAKAEAENKHAADAKANAEKAATEKAASEKAAADAKVVILANVSRHLKNHCVCQSVASPIKVCHCVCQSVASPIKVVIHTEGREALSY